VPAPDTVTDAVAFLASEGYEEDFHLCPVGILRRDEEVPHPVEGAVVDYTFRFEGPSDPSDEAIVLGVRCTEWGAKGVIVSAYGPEADPEETAILTALARRSSTGPGRTGPGPA
jgi:hypothetical protein